MFTERATNTSAGTSSSTHAGYQYQDVQINNQAFTWPTMSTTGTNLTLNRTSCQTHAHWPTYQGQNARTTEANTRTPSTSFAYPNTAHSLDPLQRDHDSTEHRNQHTSNASNTRTTQTQSNVNWRQSNPQEREIRNENHPHMPQYRTCFSHSQIDILENNANISDISMAPIGTRSTSSGFGSSSAEAITTLQRPKGNRSPIRYPTPETDKVSTVSNLGWDSSNPNLHLDKPQMDFTRTTKQNPHDLRLVNQNIQLGLMTTDHIPRKSYSHSTTDSPRPKRGAHSQSLPADNRYQGYQQNKRHHAEKDVDNFVMGMAENMKRIIVNDHHNEPGNIRSRTRPTRKWSCRQHNSKGVSNFHLDQTTK